MAKLLLFIATSLLLISCSSVNQCISNKEVANKLVSAIKTGGWHVKIHIEPIENDTYTITTEMEKEVHDLNEINYIHSAEYLETAMDEPVITRLVLSSKSVIIKYIRQLISFDTSTQKAKWNEACLDKTIIRK